jgi:hypothetical protein
MNVDTIPVPLLFAASVAVVLCAAEAGFRLGRRARRRSEEEKESPVSAIGAAILGLTGFILAFAFGIATERFDMRKALVREEAGAIRSAYARADFLPDSDRVVSKDLLRAYTIQRVTAVRSFDPVVLGRVLREAEVMQHRLWDIAVVNARRDMNSDVAALYVESLNELTNVHATRVAVAYEGRIPAGVWLVMYVLVGLGMLGLGYQAAIAGSGRSWATLLLAVSFSIVFMLVVALDRPQGTFIRVTQQPLVDVRNWMDEGGPS